jgi:hypothetical protein
MMSPTGNAVQTKRDASLMQRQRQRQRQRERERQRQRKTVVLQRRYQTLSLVPYRRIS